MVSYLWSEKKNIYAVVWGAHARSSLPFFSGGLVSSHLIIFRLFVFFKKKLLFFLPLLSSLHLFSHKTYVCSRPALACVCLFYLWIHYMPLDNVCLPSLTCCFGSEHSWWTEVAPIRWRWERQKKKAWWTKIHSNRHYIQALSDHVDGQLSIKSLNSRWW